MRSRHLITAALTAALAAGCAGAPPRASAAARRAGDAERWERSACLRGEYPYELGAHAYAQARTEDLRAEQHGEASPFAVARLEDRRTDFDARCTRWRAAQLNTAAK